MAAVARTTRRTPVLYDQADEMFPIADRDDELSALRARRIQDFAEIQRLRNELRLAQTEDTPWFGWAAIGTMLVLFGFVVGACLGPGLGIAIAEALAWA